MWQKSSVSVTVFVTPAIILSVPTLEDGKFARNQKKSHRRTTENNK